MLLDPARSDGIIYSVGKVGSTSVHRSLEEANLHYQHVHWLLLPNVLRLIESTAAQPDRRIKDHLLESLLIQNQLKLSKPIKLIVPIREPVARNVSAVFENIGPPRPLKASDALAIITRYPPRLFDTWFSTDFEPLTGLSVLDGRLDPEKDHHVLEKGRFRVLILRMESPKERQAEVLSAFVGRRVEIVIANDAESKWYDPIYREVRRSIGIEAVDYVERCLDQRYFRAFYPEAMRQQIVARYRLGGERQPAGDDLSSAEARQVAQA